MAATIYPRFVSPAIAAETFGVSLQTLRRWAREGKISFIRTPGGQHRYNVSAIIGLSAPAPAKPQKRAKAPRTLVQPQTAVHAPAPSPEAPKALAASTEPLEALIAPQSPKPTPVAPFAAEALRAQIERLSQSSAW
jgi:excisionase family DNA binding protein